MRLDVPPDPVVSDSNLEPIFIGVVVAIILVAAAVWWLLRRRRD